MVRQLKETGIKGTVSRGLWAKFVFYIYITVFCKKNSSSSETVSFFLNSLFLWTECRFVSGPFCFKSFKQIVLNGEDVARLPSYVAHSVNFEYFYIKVFSPSFLALL